MAEQTILPSPAPLKIINFVRLVTKDLSEEERLLEACRNPGFFYLDFQNDSTHHIVADVEAIENVSARYFDQPEEVKMQYFRSTDDRGYKPGADESFEIAHDEILDGTLQLPPILNDNVELLKRFARLSHYFTHTMLSCLSDALHLEGKNHLAASHRTGEPTNSAVKLIYEPTQAKLADVVENKHTDYGTLTLLFGKEQGLQIEYPETKEWAFVEPKKGLAVVNVADSLHHLSGKKLHSCTHRVTQLADGFLKRFYVVYLLRPEIALGFDR